MVFGKASFELIVVSAILVTTVTGHGYGVLPPVAFIDNVQDKTSHMAIIESSTSGFLVEQGRPDVKAVQFAAALESSQYSTLKEFVQDKMVLLDPSYTKECGYTDPNAPPQPLPPHFEWGTAGFTKSHNGCCELLCGPVRVFFDKDCPKHYPMKPAQLPFDQAACVNADRMDFYWIALHNEQWQVYLNCIPLQSGGGGSNSTTPSRNGPTPAPGRTGTSTPPAPGGTNNSPPPYAPGGTGTSKPPSPGGTGNSTPPSPGGNSPPPYTPGGTGNPPSPSPGGTGNPPSPSPGGTGNSTPPSPGGNSPPPSPGGNSPPPYTPGGTGNPPSPSPGGTGTSTPPSPGGTGNSTPSGNGNKCVRRLES